MTKTLLGALLSLQCANTLAMTYPGVPSREQTPLVQSYFIPAMPVSSQDSWSFSHALYITNTYQADESEGESLVIDVENTRYDFQATYQREQWLFNTNLSWIQNRAGFLDQTIKGWHDIFGLPQGGRDQIQSDQLELSYLNNGRQVADFRQAQSGIGDVQLAIGHTLGQGQIWFGLELSVTNDKPLLSNDGIDVALWYANASPATETQLYGFGGIAIPADSGLFQGQLNSHYFFGQLGLLYRLNANWQFFVQADFHSAIVADSQLDALDHSLQGQFGVRLPSLMKDYQLDLFFSEDIFPGHAPDITFALRFSPK